MRKSTIVSVALSTLGLTLGYAAQATASPSETSSSSQAASQAAAPDQARIAESTLKLENAFADQFVKGHIDRDALAPLIGDVVQAMPEATRSRVQAHIDEVIALGQQNAAQMTPEQRAQLAAPKALDPNNKVQVDTFGAWGWGYPGLGWGGYGAFGWPYYGTSLGWNGLGWGGLGWGGLGWGTGWNGLGGWGWGW